MIWLNRMPVSLPCNFVNLVFLYCTPELFLAVTFLTWNVWSVHFAEQTRTPFSGGGRWHSSSCAAQQGQAESPYSHNVTNSAQPDRRQRRQHTPRSWRRGRRRARGGGSTARGSRGEQRGGEGWSQPHGSALFVRDPSPVCFFLGYNLKFLGYCTADSALT